MAKILIVEDSSLSRRMLRKILEPAGHDIIEAADGISALEQYYLAQPDLVLLDLIMTGMDGMEVLAKLREMNPEVRVIIATADIQSSTQEMVRKEGALGFINKPFEAETVLNAVHAVLSKG